MDEQQLTSLLLFIERGVTRRPLTDDQKAGIKHLVNGGTVQVVDELNQPIRIVLL